MHFIPQAIDGVVLVRPEPLRDERGAFARVFCTEEFARQGLVAAFAQASVSVNNRAGTLRGMHYSVGPHEETKLVRCTKGAIHDVLVDIRPGSSTQGVTLAFNLAADSHDALYVPAGVAHGFQTLRDDSEILYMIDKPYLAEAARGLRWNDAIVGHDWPLPVAAMSERDRSYPDFLAAAS